MNAANVLVSLVTKDNDFQRAQAAAVEETARRLGVTIDICYAEGDAVNQSQQILKAIQDKNCRYTGVIVEPVGTGMLQIAKVATAAHIAWVVINQEVDYVAQLRRTSNSPIFEVGSDQIAAGRIQAQQFSALLPQGGTVLYIEGPSTRIVAQQRTKGMLAAKPSNIEIKVLRGDWTEESAHKIVRNWMGLSTSRSLNVGVVGCQNDEMAVGARKAFSEAVNDSDREAWLGLPFTGCDGLPETGQEFVRRGQITATVVIPPNAGLALELLMKARQPGVVIPERTLSAPRSYPPVEELRPRTVAGRRL